MADEVAQTNASDSGAKQKMFSTKGLILVVIVFVVYTAGLFYMLRGDMGKASEETTTGITDDILKIQTRLVLEQNMIPPLLIEDIMVPIKLDKNGDTSKNVSASFSIQVGLTATEEAALDAGEWGPKRRDVTRFQFSIKPDAYNSDWSLIDEVLGPDGLNKKPGENKDSYLYLLGNAKEEIRAKIIQLLLSTTYSQLNTEDGRANIADSIKNEINEYLVRIGKFKRVYKVNWTKYIFH